MPESVQIELICRHESFRFKLWHRSIEFGDAGPGEYYWMDGSSLRSGSGGENLRSCIDFWWACAEEAGESDDPLNQTNLVLAEGYPLVNTSRAMQKVFLDAHLNKSADRKVVFEDDQGDSQRRSVRTYQLPEEESARLVELVRTRDVRQIQHELESLFLGDLPPENERPAFQKATQHWIGQGVVAFRKGGHEALRNYIHGDLNREISKYRKGGVNERVRLFLNLFSYECKAAFYGCYANAWAFLLPKLQEEQGVSDIAVRFMQLWHHQNQPQQVQGGETLNVFSGQVLSLHPLSAVILTDPGYLGVVGHWIGHPDYERLHADNNIDSCQEYWNFVSTILIAAHEYRQSHDRWDATRGQTETVRSKSVEQAVQTDQMRSANEALEDYAADNSVFCDECSGPLEYECHTVPADETLSCTVTYRCSSCQHQQSLEIRFEDLRESLLRPDDERDG